MQYKFDYMAIPVNIEKLISNQVVENERIEYKKEWNPVAIPDNMRFRK
ncbi:hypothetical protein EZS27_000197 [termite gut metagenome]|uniref:Uncharacterized protein n=1 Tax=termite gut metagenome TaxID=433724 RepID=A0A5J4T1V4_9ZZZZ